MSDNPNAIVPVVNSSIIQSMADAERAAMAMAKSGFFQDAKDASQAIVKILAGQELGFGPFASMTGVNIIQNKPVLAANLMAAAVKRTGKYNYRVKELTDEACELVFFEAGKEVGNSKFTMADAKAALLDQKDNWRKYPRNMLFARALSNGQKWYAPDVFNGATVYTPDELGADVDDEGNAIQGSFKVTEIKPVPPPAGDRPYSPDALKERLKVMSDSVTGKCTDGQRQAVLINLKTMTGGEPQYHEVLKWLTGYEHINEVPDNLALALHKWIHPTKQPDGTFLPDEHSIQEAIDVYDFALLKEPDNASPDGDH
jgi:hypothetical protein